MGKKKIALDGTVDAQQRFYRVIDDYFAHGDMEADLEALPPEKRLQVMGKFAEFRWGKKTANPEDEATAVNSTSELLTAVYEELTQGKDV